MTLLDRLTAHLDVADALIAMVLLAAAYLAACGLVGAGRAAVRRWCSAQDDDPMPTDTDEPAWSDDACALTLPAIGPDDTRIRTCEEFDAEFRAWLAHEPGRRD